MTLIARHELGLNRTLVVLMLTLLAASASAMDIETYDKQAKLPPSSPVQVRLSSYLLGIGEGLRLANFGLRQRGDPELFCAPDTANLFAADYKRLIDAQLAGARATLYNQQASIEQILLKALQETYACPSR